MSASPESPLQIGLPTKQKWTLDNFEFGRHLGCGQYGHVYLAREKKSKHIVAIKCISKTQLVDLKKETMLRNEIEIQSNIRHPNILVVYGFFYDDRRVYLIQEFAPQGDLFNKLDKMGCFSEHRAARYTSELADALQYCHSKHVIHRDIKLENLLLGQHGEIKLADFGFAVRSCTKRKTFGGTDDYMAPEIVNRKDHDKQVDTWSLGVLLFEFLTGGAPFSAATPQETHDRINKFDIAFPHYMATDAQDLIRKLLARTPGQRMALDDVHSHPFIVRCQPQEQQPKRVPTASHSTSGAANQSV